MGVILQVIDQNLIDIDRILFGSADLPSTHLRRGTYSDRPDKNRCHGDLTIGEVSSDQDRKTKSQGIDPSLL